MEKVRCSGCGSSDFHHELATSTCVYCKTVFKPVGSRPAPSQTDISIRSDVERLLDKCAAEPTNAQRYANLILDIDPTNETALDYLRGTR